MSKGVEPFLVHRIGIKDGHQLVKYGFLHGVVVCAGKLLPSAISTNLNFCIQDVEKLRYGLKRKKILRKYRKNGAFCTNIRNYFAPILLHTAKSGLKTARARGKGAQGVVFALKGPNSPEFLLQLLLFSRYRQKTKKFQFRHSQNVCLASNFSLFAHRCVCGEGVQIVYGNPLLHFIQ